jgi:hypothetical protein
MIALVPRPIRKIARRYINNRGFIPISQGPADLDKVMQRCKLPQIATVIDDCFTPGGAVRMTIRPYTDAIATFYHRVRLFGYYRVCLPVWHFALDLTRPLRTILELRSKEVRARNGNQSG